MLVCGALIQKNKVTNVHYVHIGHITVLPAHCCLRMLGNPCQRLNIFHPLPVNVLCYGQRRLLFCGWVWCGLTLGMENLSLGGIVNPRPGGIDLFLLEITYTTS